MTILQDATLCRPKKNHVFLRFLRSMEIIGWIIFFIFLSLSLRNAAEKKNVSLKAQHAAHLTRKENLRAIYNERQKTSSYIKLTIITVGFVIKKNNMDENCQL